MRLFEDIIDSVETAQDVRSASSVVAPIEEDEPIYEIFRHYGKYEPFSKKNPEFSHNIILYKNTGIEIEENELVRQLNTLHSILEYSPVIAEYSKIYAYYSQFKTDTQINVWFDYVENPDWTSVFSFIARINNCFWNPKASSNTIFIYHYWDADTKRQMDLDLKSSRQRNSFWYIMNYCQNRMQEYLKTHNDPSPEEIYDYIEER